VRSQGWPPARASGRRAAVPVAARRSRGRVCRLLFCSVPRQGKGRRRPEDHRSADPRMGLLAPWITSSDRRRSAPSSRTTPAVAANWSCTPGNAKPYHAATSSQPRLHHIRHADAVPEHQTVAASAPPYPAVTSDEPLGEPIFHAPTLSSSCLMLCQLVSVSSKWSRPCCLLGCVAGL
jgi:hypothetical protein